MALQRVPWAGSGNASHQCHLPGRCALDDGHNVELVNDVWRQSFDWLWRRCFDWYHSILHCRSGSSRHSRTIDWVSREYLPEEGADCMNRYFDVRVERNVCGIVLTPYFTGRVPGRVNASSQIVIRMTCADSPPSSLVGFWVNYGINQNMEVGSTVTFRIPIALQFIPGGLLALGTLILRESPALLYRRGKKERAIKNLCYLRQLPAEHQYMLEEVGMIEARLAEETKLSGGRSGWLALLRGAGTELKNRSIRYRLYVTIGMFLFQNWSGSICIK